MSTRPPINAGSALAAQIGATSAEMGRTAMQTANLISEGFQKAYNGIHQWQKDHDDRNKFKKEMEVKGVELENATEELRQRKDIFNKTYVDRSINIGTTKKPNFVTPFEAQIKGELDKIKSQTNVNNAQAYLLRGQGDFQTNELDILKETREGQKPPTTPPPPTTPTPPTLFNFTSYLFGMRTPR